MAFQFSLLRPAQFSLLALSLATVLAGCARSHAQPSNNAGQAAANEPLQIAQEDVVLVQRNELAAGVVITGTVQPERRADLRAEMSSLVLQVLRENGEHVKKGDLLVRLDDTAVRDNLASADEAARIAGLALAQFDRQVQRVRRLHGMGLASMQEVEEAEIRHGGAQGELAAAKARAAQARQLLQRTEVRAPFDGITSERKVSPGDTAQVGKELIKVLDPASMRLEGLVSADRIGSVKVGQAVDFQINAYPARHWHGRIRRVDPAASAATRQVAVLVEFDNDQATPVAGLYAEGRIDAAGATALSIKGSALVHEGGQDYAWCVRDAVLHRVALQLGEPDPRNGHVAVRAGLAEGDTIIRRPGAGLREGQKVVVTATGQPSA